MLTSNPFSFFSKNPIIGISLVIFVSLFIILAATQHNLIWNVLSSGNIYGDIVWESFTSIENKVKQTQEYVDFVSKYENIQSLGDTHYLADRKIGFKSIQENQTIFITFKILPDGSIGRITTNFLPLLGMSSAHGDSSSPVFESSGSSAKLFGMLFSGTSSWSHMEPYPVIKSNLNLR